MRDPNSNLPFHIYTDASYYQASTSIITHQGKLVEAWSQKLKEEQENYSTMLEKEMLSVVLWLKSFHTFVIGNNKTDAAIQMLGMDLGQQLDFVCLYGYLWSLSCTIQIQKLIINCLAGSLYIPGDETRQFRQPADKLIWI